MCKLTRASEAWQGRARQARQWPQHVGPACKERRREVGGGGYTREAQFPSSDLVRQVMRVLLRGAAGAGARLTCRSGRSQGAGGLRCTGRRGQTLLEVCKSWRLAEADGSEADWCPAEPSPARRRNCRLTVLPASFRS